MDWESSTGDGTITYVLEWGYFDDSLVSWVDSLLDNISESSYVISFVGAQPGRWRVKAKSEYGESEWSDWFGFEFSV